MLKKNQPVKFSRPMSTMRTVLMAVENGHQTKLEITNDTGLKAGQVQSALWNLVYVGVVIKASDANGRTVYRVPGRQYSVAPCLCGIRSIFDAK